MQLGRSSLKCILVLSVVSVMLVGSANAAQTGSQKDSGKTLDNEKELSKEPLVGADELNKRAQVLALITPAEVNTDLKRRESFKTICDEKLMDKVAESIPAPKKTGPVSPHLIDRHFYEVYIGSSDPFAKKDGPKGEDHSVRNAEADFLVLKDNIAAYHGKVQKFTASYLSQLGRAYLPYRFSVIDKEFYKILGVTPATASKVPAVKVDTAPEFFSKLNKNPLRADRFAQTSMVLQTELKFGSLGGPGTNDKQVPPKPTRNFKWVGAPEKPEDIAKLFDGLDADLSQAHSNLCIQVTTLIMVALNHKSFAKAHADLRAAHAAALAVKPGTPPSSLWQNSFKISEAYLKEFYWAVSTGRAAECTVDGATSLQAAVSLSLIGKDITDAKLFAKMVFFTDGLFQTLLSVQVYQSIIEFDRTLIIGLGQNTLVYLLQISQQRHAFHIEFFDCFNFITNWMVPSDATDGKKAIVKNPNDVVNGDMLKKSPASKRGTIGEAHLFVGHTYKLLYKVYVYARGEGIIKPEDDMPTVWRTLLYWLAGHDIGTKFALNAEIYQKGFFNFDEVQMYYPATVSYLCLMIGKDCMAVADDAEIPEKYSPAIKKTALDNALGKTDPPTYYKQVVNNIVHGFDTIEVDKVVRSKLVDSKIFRLSICEKWRAKRDDDKRFEAGLTKFYYALLHIDVTYEAPPNINPKLAAAEKHDPLWHTLVSTCVTVDEDGKEIKIADKTKETRSFQYLFDLKCTEEIYKRYVKVIETYLSSNVLVTVGQFHAYFRQLIAVMSLQNDYHVQSIIIYLTLRYIRSYEGNATPKIPVVFVKLFIDYYAFTRVNTLDVSKNVGFYHFMVSTFGTQTDVRNPSTLYNFRLTPEEAEAFVLDLYLLLQRGLTLDKSAKKISDIEKTMMLREIKRFADYGLRSAGKNQPNAWENRIKELDAIFQATNPNLAPSATDAAKKVADVGTEVNKGLATYLQISKHLAALHIFSATTDFYQYFDPSAQRKGEDSQNLALKPLLIAFSTFYHFNLRVRLNFDSDARLVHSYLLTKLQNCLTFLSAETPTALEIAANKGVCDLSYRKYAEIYFLYKMYLRVDKQMSDVNLDNFKPDVQMVRLGTFFYFALNDGLYRQNLLKYCGMTESKDTDKKEAQNVRLCTVCKLTVQTANIYQARIDMPDDGQFFSLIKPVFVAFQEQKPYIEAKKMLLTFGEAVAIACTQNADSLSAFYSQLSYLFESEDVNQILKTDPVLQSLQISEFLSLGNTPTEVAFLAQFFKLNYRKQRIEEKERPVRAAVQSLLALSKGKIDAKDSKDLTLQNFLTVGENQAVEIVKIFLMYSETIEEFTTVAQYILRNKVFMEIVSFDNENNSQWIQKTIAALNEAKLDVTKAENVKTLVAMLLSSVTDTFTVRMGYVAAVVEEKVEVAEGLPESNSQEKMMGILHGNVHHVGGEIVEQNKLVQTQISKSVQVVVKNLIGMQQEAEFKYLTEESTSIQLKASTNIEEQSIQLASTNEFKTVEGSQVLDELQEDIDNSVMSLSESKTLGDQKTSTTSVSQDDDEEIGGADEEIDNTVDILNEVKDELESDSLANQNVLEEGKKLEEEMEEGKNEERLRRVRRVLRSWMPRAALNTRRVRI